MKKRPELKGMDVFFNPPPEQQNTKSSDRIASYRKHWKKEGLTMITFWIPTSIVQAIKLRAIRDNKKISTIATELLTNALK